MVALHCAPAHVSAPSPHRERGRPHPARRGRRLSLPTAGGLHALTLSPRQLLERLFAAAVTGAQPGPATGAAVARVPHPESGRVHVFAIGKGARAMAEAAVGALAGLDVEPVGGIVVGPDTAPAPHPALCVVAGDHPIPGPRSARAADALGDAVAAVRGEDLVFVLLSGGASSLVGAPLPGVGLTRDDLTDLTLLLLGSGLGIGAMNAVRKRVARWGSGRLAAALAPAEVRCLVVSDVVGDDLGTIGSGPCVADPTPAPALIAELVAAELWPRLPDGVREYLVATAAGFVPRPPRPEDAAFANVRTELLLSNVSARRAAARSAQQAGVPFVTVHHVPLVGEAAPQGERLVEMLVARATSLRRRTRALRAGPHGVLECHVWGGEPTVRLADAPPGAHGGRMQELALAAARALHDAGDDGRRIALLAAGTDGRDGPTDAAGAVVDASTWRRVRQGGRMPDADLAAHQSHRALDAAHALLRTGLTGTNVGDVVIGMVRSEGEGG